MEQLRVQAWTMQGANRYKGSILQIQLYSSLRTTHTWINPTPQHHPLLEIWFDKSSCVLKRQWSALESGGSHLLLNKELICCIDHTWQGCSKEFAGFSFVISTPPAYLCALAVPYMCICVHTQMCVHLMVHVLEGCMCTAALPDPAAQCDVNCVCVKSTP